MCLLKQGSFVALMLSMPQFFLFSSVVQSRKITDKIGNVFVLFQGFTFTKTTKKSLFRFLPLALDQFSKIASLESTLSLYVDGDFDK